MPRGSVTWWNTGGRSGWTSSMFGIDQHLYSIRNIPLNCAFYQHQTYVFPNPSVVAKPGLLFKTFNCNVIE